tara:strand:- start:11 stop:469 length:459 start_codon:yes stop_codon:yes gene_type:complete
MSEEINFNKTVFNKTQYTKTINTSFSELGVKTIQEQLDEQPNIEEFFSLYNELFYDIPELGETDSHEFLIKQSSEYINFEEENEVIEELQKEISQLREDLLDSQKQVIELELGISVDDNQRSLPRSTPLPSSAPGGTTGGSSGGSSGGGGGY